MPDPHSDMAAGAADVRTALKEAMHRLRSARVPSFALAAELLLMHTLGCDRAWLYTHPEAFLLPAAEEKYFSLVARRSHGEPTQYLTGRQEFWGLEFEVNPAVLIPRPETEHVMEVALERLGPRGIKIRLDTGLPNDALRVADIGTGSGCLAVALAYELPHAEVFATDISAPALEVATRNALRHGVSDRVHFVECDLLAAFAGSHSGDSPGGFDLIVSNPPYIARNEAGALPREVRDHEPHLALFGGSAGVEIYTGLIEQAAGLLRPRGILAVELGYDSAGRVLAIIEAQPNWRDIRLTNDLAGIPRVLSATVV